MRRADKPFNQREPPCGANLKFNATLATLEPP
jgi:hypothetical protein